MVTIPRSLLADNKPGKAFSLSEQYPPLRPLLEAVEQQLQRFAQAQQKVLAEGAEYAISGPGKRLRPALLLLAGEACGGAGEKAVELAAVVELLHTASLVHDDVIDEAEWRRGKASARMRWGNKISVLLGDYLFCRALSYLLQTAESERLRQLFELAQQMCQGQVAELSEMSPEITEARYLEIISAKTAALFRFCGQAGGECGGASPEAARGLADFGENFGLAFQLADDIHDLIGSQAASGKPVNHDLRQGKITLPMIFALRTLNGEKQASLRRALTASRRGEEELEQLARLAAESGGLDYAWERCREYLQAARKALQVGTSERRFPPDSNAARARRTLDVLCEEAFPLPILA
jgi:octaprenyl-diphosphate synthase